MVLGFYGGALGHKEWAVGPESHLMGQNECLFASDFQRCRCRCSTEDKDFCTNNGFDNN